MTTDSKRQGGSLASRVPFLSGFYELDTGPQRFLMYAFCNVVSWQCILGPVVVLFARKIDMPASWVGLLLSFMPLSTLLVIFMVQPVTKLGPKRLMMGAWLIRNVLMCSIFAMPWVLAHWGFRSGWYLLMAGLLGFCIARAAGAAAWFPWLHELVPEKQRGTYFGMEMTVVQLMNVVILLGQGLLLGGDPSVNRFLFVYAIGIAAGFVSVVLMRRIPGGLVVDCPSAKGSMLRHYREALADRPFLRFVAIASLCFAGTTWFNAAHVLYMRDVLGLQSRTIMILMTVGGGAILLTIRFWGRFADHSGSGRAMTKTLSAHALFSLLWLFVLPDSKWTMPLVVIVLTPMFIFGGAFYLAAHRALLNFIRPVGRVGYSNIWTAACSISTGITPILVGQFIQRWELNGFRACFVIAGCMGLALALLCPKVVPDGIPVAQSRKRLLNPVLPLRTLGRIAWITVGLHESNRPRSGE
jgi:predicted MFS family arabinose efflux permease